MHRPSANVVRVLAAMASMVGFTDAVTVDNSSPSPSFPPLPLPLRSISRTKHGGGGSTRGRIMARRIDDPREYHPVSAEARRLRRNKRKAAARARRRGK